MNIEQRIRLCRLIEKMYYQKTFSQKLGIEDRSTFRGNFIDRREGKEHVDHII